MSSIDGKLRVMLVDDHALVRSAVRQAIAAPDVELVGEAANAQEALALAPVLRPDILLLDIDLPGMNGIDALGVLRANAATAKIPVIAVTASVMQQDRKLITEAGFDGYIGKPINLKEFLATVRKWLGEDS